jgi:hypothetical protein
MNESEPSNITCCPLVVFGVDMATHASQETGNEQDCLVISGDVDGATTRFVMTLDDARYLRNQLILNVPEADPS